MKGLILSGGTGTRLRPITHTSAKQLVPVANKPVLFYGIEAMAKAGITEVGIIIAPETGDEIRDRSGDGSQFGVKITYIVQDEPARPGPRGAHRRAVPRRRPVRHVPRRQPPAGRHRGPRRAFESNEPDALILLTPVPDPEHFGVAELDGDRVIALVEKPPEPATNLALVGVYLFAPIIHDAARAIEPSARGELEITDAIQHLIDSGYRVEPHIVQGWWKDTGRLEDMLEANRLILEHDRARASRASSTTTRRSRAASIVEAGARLERATVRGPAVIGAGAHLIDCYIGPYTAIGEGCHVDRAEIEHSILLANASVHELNGRLESSLLGRNVKVSRDVGQPRAFRLIVGDNCEIAHP